MPGIQEGECIDYIKFIKTQIILKYDYFYFKIFIFRRINRIRLDLDCFCVLSFYSVFPYKIMRSKRLFLLKVL